MESCCFSLRTVFWMQGYLLSTTLPTALVQMLIDRSALIQAFRISCYLPLCFQSSPPLCRPQVVLKLLIMPYKAPPIQIPTYCPHFLKSSSLGLAYCPTQLAPLYFHLFVCAGASAFKSSIPHPACPYSWLWMGDSLGYELWAGTVETVWVGIFH